MPCRMDDELFSVLTELLEWASQMGGWEAPCWERARKVADRYRDTQEKTADAKLPESCVTDDRTI